MLEINFRGMLEIQSKYIRRLFFSCTNIDININIAIGIKHLTTA